MTSALVVAVIAAVALAVALGVIFYDPAFGTDVFDWFHFSIGTVVFAGVAVLGSAGWWRMRRNLDRNRPGFAVIQRNEQIRPSDSSLN